MRFRVLGFGLAMAVGLAGCGSSSSTSSPTTQTTATSAAPAPTVTQTVTKTTPPPTTQAAPTPTTTSSTPSGGGGGGSGQTVPSDIINKKLDDAEDELTSMGIQFSVDSGDHVVILRGDWGVCSTTPAPGAQINGAVVLHVGHFTCGAD